MAHLIVTVDTEEEGLWSGQYRPTGNTVENIRGVPRFQELCDRFGIQPVYLIDAPVVQSDDAVKILRPIHDDGRCEIGTHVHPWCNPPFEEEINDRNSYLCNLPEQLQRQKITWLTETIERRIGRRPTSFRAGRYGMDIIGARILEELGYVVDSSVIPFTDYSHQHGPNFDSAPCDPYYVSETDFLAQQPTGQLLEVPVTVGYNRASFSRAHAIRSLAMTAPLRKLRAVGILDRLGLVRRIKLSPEQADSHSITTLIDACLKRQSECLVLMFHSSSLMPGFSPYVPDAPALDRFYERLERCFEYCLGKHAMSALTLTDFSLERN